MMGLPLGRSMNSYAEKFNFHYHSLDDAVSVLTPQCCMAKLDQGLEMDIQGGRIQTQHIL